MYRQMAQAEAIYAAQLNHRMVAAQSIAMPEAVSAWEAERQRGNPQAAAQPFHGPAGGKGSLPFVAYTCPYCAKVFASLHYLDR